MVTKHHWIEKIPGIVGSMTPCLPVSVWSPVSAEAASSNPICAEVSFWSLEISKLGWFWAFFQVFVGVSFGFSRSGEIRLRGGPGHLSGSRCLGGKAGLAAGTAQRRLAGTWDGWENGVPCRPSFWGETRRNYTFGRSKKPRVIGQLGVPILSGLNGLTHNRFQF